MEGLLDGIGTMIALIGVAIAIDFVFNGGNALTQIIRTIRGEKEEEEE